MSGPDNTGPGESRWQRLWRVPRSRWLLGIPAGAVLAALVGAGGITAFVGAVELSSTETFCISCHEMRDNVYAEYKKTIHYNNRTGVRATCPDCHVPKEWGPKLLRKMGATFKELPNHFLGKLDTKEKFEAYRTAMAQSVWDTMENRKSQECRNCHSLQHMDLEVQDKTAKRKHAQYLEKGKDDCIDCHQGIAHEVPKDAVFPEHADESAGTAPTN